MDAHINEQTNYQLNEQKNSIFSCFIIKRSEKKMSFDATIILLLYQKGP